MQFQIPQFIEVEDKIFGPFTFRQFVYLGGGAGISYILFRLFPIFLSLPLIGCVMAFVGGLAFMQLNGRPFIIALEHGFFYSLHPKLYLWNNRRAQKKTPVKQVISSEQASAYVPKLSDSRLHELAWSLDIKERITAGIANDEERAQGGGVMAPVMTMRKTIR